MVAQLLDTPRETGYQTCSVQTLKTLTPVRYVLAILNSGWVLTISASTMYQIQAAPHFSIQRNWRRGPRQVRRAWITGVPLLLYAREASSIFLRRSFDYF